tara:strand:+ start:684 stop:935 length:252 start_codon:yes stop_codon:yes gene_type:complete
MSIKKLLEKVEPANKAFQDTLAPEHYSELVELVEIWKTDPDYIKRKSWAQLARFFGERWGRPRMRGETLKRTVENFNGREETA